MVLGPVVQQGAPQGRWGEAGRRASGVGAGQRSGRARGTAGPCRRAPQAPLATPNELASEVSAQDTSLALPSVQAVRSSDASGTVTDQARLLPGVRPGPEPDLCNRTGQQAPPAIREEGMGQRLDVFEFAPPRPAGRAPKYPWDEWTDGSIWQILRGRDYDVETRSIQATLFSHATFSELRVRTRRVFVDGHDGLVFQFFAREGSR